MRVSPDLINYMTRIPPIMATHTGCARMTFTCMDAHIQHTDIPAFSNINKKFYYLLVERHY